MNGEGHLVVSSQTDANALQRRLTELRDLAFRDPRAAEAYNRREISKYVYLTLPSLTPEVRGLLCRMDRGLISPAEVNRRFNQDEIDFALRYRGGREPFRDPFYERQNRLVYAMRTLLTPATFAQVGTANGRAVVDGSDLLDRYDGERRAKFLLRQAPPSELHAVARYLSGHMDDLDEVFWTDAPGAPMPALLRDMRPLLRRDSAEDLRRTALQMTTYISFVLSVQGTNSLDRYLIDECRNEFSGADEASCSLRAGIRTAAESPDEFDNASMRRQLIEHLGRFYANHLSLSPAERVSQQGLLLEGELGSALMGGQFGPAFTSAELQGVLDDVRRQLGVTHIPPPRGIPLTWEEIRGVRDTPLEVRIDELPNDMQELARQITVSVPRTGGQPPWQGNLLDYLRQNVDVVVLTRRAPHLSDAIGEPEATANRLFRTVVLDIDGPQSVEAGDADKEAFEILSTLAHEAYHNDYFHNLIPYNTRLARATALNERNAHLLEANVLQQILRIHLPEMLPLIEQARRGEDAIRLMGESAQRRLVQFNREFERIPALYASHRLTGLAANAPLEYRLTDDGLWNHVFPETRLETLGRYPSAFTTEYLRMRRLTQEQFMTQTQDELFTSLGLQNPNAPARPQRGRSGSR